MFDTFKADLDAYMGGDTSLRKKVYACFEMSIWAIAVFRFGKWAQRIPVRPLRMPFTLIYFFMYKVTEAVTQIRISSESEIGPGLHIHNFGGILIKGRIGRNLTVVQGAQIVARADGKGSGWPTLGDNVYLGSGAKVIGPVKVGDNVRVGANAVVMTDVPANSVVMPPESRVIRGFYRGPRKPAPDSAEKRQSTESAPAEERATPEEKELPQ